VSAAPMDVFILVALPLKLVTCVCMWCVAQNTRGAYSNGSLDYIKYYLTQLTLWSHIPGATPGLTFFAPLILVMLASEISGNLILISLVSFFSKVSDPTIGGSYMTLLTTLTNLGSIWPSSLRYNPSNVHKKL